MEIAMEIVMNVILWFFAVITGAALVGGCIGFFIDLFRPGEGRLRGILVFLAIALSVVMVFWGAIWMGNHRMEVESRLGVSNIFTTREHGVLGVWPWKDGEILDDVMPIVILLVVSLILMGGFELMRLNWPVTPRRVFRIPFVVGLLLGPVSAAVLAWLVFDALFFWVWL